MTRPTLTSIAALGLLIACGSTDRTDDPPDHTTPRDGGAVTSDAGPADAGERDGGALDGGALDGGTRDGGTRDSGPPPPRVCERVRATRLAVTGAGLQIAGLVAVDDGYLLVFERYEEVDTRHAIKLDRDGAIVGAEQDLGPVVDDRASVVADGDGAAFVATRPLAGLALTRVDSNGAVIGAPITIGPLGSSTNSALARTDDGFGVTYSIGEAGFDHQVFFRRLDATGQPVAPAVPLTDGSELDFSTAIAWNGSHFGVAFQRQIDRSTQRVYFRLLDEDGVQQTTTSSIPDDVFATTPSLSSDGDGFLLGTSVRGTAGQLRRLAANGDPIQVLMPTGIRPEVVWDGARYVFATTWFELPLDLWSLAPNSIPVRLASNVAEESLTSNNPRLAWDGLGYALVWTQRPVVGGDTVAFFARECP